MRRQDGRTGRQASTDDTKRAIMTDMCPIELERHLVLNSDRYDTYAKVKSAIREYTEHMRHKSGPVEVDEIPQKADAKCDGEWEAVHGAGQAKGKRPLEEQRRGYFPYKCHTPARRDTQPRSAEKRAKGRWKPAASRAKATGLYHTERICTSYTTVRQEGQVAQEGQRQRLRPAGGLRMSALRSVRPNSGSNGRCPTSIGQSGAGTGSGTPHGFITGQAGVKPCGGVQER